MAHTVSLTSKSFLPLGKVRADVDLQQGGRDWAGGWVRPPPSCVWYVQTTSRNVHSDLENRQKKKKKVNLSAPCFPKLAGYHITWTRQKWTLFGPIIRPGDSNASAQGLKIYISRTSPQNISEAAESHHMVSFNSHNVSKGLGFLNLFCWWGTETRRGWGSLLKATQLVYQDLFYPEKETTPNLKMA